MALVAVISRNELNRVTLSFIENGKKVPELIVGRKYKIRATVSGPGSTFNQP
ncbi:hypothetical protein BIW11_04915 [Tropilaelaps mercedesae]|uniref:Uncharacterized protein n=1 Tax=Tropilaelaps mercedesae TaxID=418985 RepID=A0A1V9X099_9ACAR|nr:hypothetical protein BIW11_04915 [Tropilaelaps mercedesae]